MSFSPETQLILVNLAILLVAYELIYPGIRGITPLLMGKIDIILSGLALTIAAVLFWGTGTEFSLVFFSTNWAVFSLVAMAVMEIPFYLWFCRSRGLNPFDIDGEG